MRVADCILRAVGGRCCDCDPQGCFLVEKVEFMHYVTLRVQNSTFPLSKLIPAHVLGVSDACLAHL